MTKTCGAPTPAVLHVVMPELIHIQYTGCLVVAQGVMGTVVKTRPKRNKRVGLLTVGALQPILDDLPGEPRLAAETLAAFWQHFTELVAGVGRGLHGSEQQAEEGQQGQGQASTPAGEEAVTTTGLVLEVSGCNVGVAARPRCLD